MIEKCENIDIPDAITSEAVNLKPNESKEDLHLRRLQIQNS